MFAHLLVTAVLMSLLGIGLYKLIMWFIRRNKKLQAAFAEARQTLQERLDDLKRKKKEVSNLEKSIGATEKLAKLETEIADLSAKIETLDAKRGK